MNIYGKNVFLRAMEPEDMELLRKTVNDPEMERLVGGWSFPVSKHTQLQWYERVVNDKQNLRLIIETIETGEAIGMANLVNIDWKNRSAFHGIKLFETAPKRCGYATDAVNALMKYAFEELQLMRLDGSWIESNTASLALYRKCGWKVEGRKEKAIYQDGEYHTLLLGGILAETYFSMQ